MIGSHMSMSICSQKLMNLLGHDPILTEGMDLGDEYAI